MESFRMASQLIFQTFQLCKTKEKNIAIYFSDRVEGHIIAKYLKFSCYKVDVFGLANLETLV